MISVTSTLSKSYKYFIFFYSPPFLSKPSRKGFEFAKIENVFFYIEALQLRNLTLGRHIFISPFSKWFFSTYRVPGTFLDAEARAMNKANKVPALKEFKFGCEKVGNKCMNRLVSDSIISCYKQSKPE